VGRCELLADGLLSDDIHVLSPLVEKLFWNDEDNATKPRIHSNMREYQELYQATLEKWGEEAQYDQAIEECAELIASLKHFKRGKVTEAEIIDELADVTLMIGQLTWMFGAEKIDRAIKEKLKKLHDLLMAGCERK
jgi:hypothetical protein